MKNFPLLLLLLGLTTYLPAQLTVHSGSHLTLSPSSVLTVVGLDVEVQTGGTLTNQGIVYTNQTFTTDGTLITDIAGTTPGVDYGRVTADAGAALGGTLTATQAAAYTPVGLTSHPVVLTGSRAGTFGTENLPSTAWLVDYTATAADVVFDLSLPVSWLTFTASAQGKSVVLTWATAAEQNNDYFVVERRQPGSDTWTDAGRVAANEGGQTAGNYSFLDRSPPAADELVYRIRQVDFDGAYSYSPVRAVAFSLPMNTSLVFPNPTSGEVFFAVDPTQVIALELYDGAGRLLLRHPLEAEAGSQRFVFPEDLAAGIYLLRLGDYTQRVVLRR